MLVRSAVPPGKEAFVDCSARMEALGQSSLSMKRLRIDEIFKYSRRSRWDAPWSLPEILLIICFFAGNYEKIGAHQIRVTLVAFFLFRFCFFFLLFNRGTIKRNVALVDIDAFLRMIPFFAKERKEAIMFSGCNFKQSDYRVFSKRIACLRINPKWFSEIFARTISRGSYFETFKM